MTMTQYVFIHGPGAGGCSDSYVNQLEHFPGSLAPDLPGHRGGAPCPDVAHYTEWLRGWLWAQDHRQDLVLAGFTLGACIALQYGLDYPEEVKALVLMTVAMGPKTRPPETLEFRQRAARDPQVYQQWKDAMAHSMMFIDPDLRGHLLKRHDEVGPISQYRDLVTIDEFDVRDRIHTLQPPLLLIRGVDDPGRPPEYELEIHPAVPGSRYLKLENAGHFPMAERPQDVNRAIEDFVGSLP
jgi:pimeloyl-ACP methyl ester carboxylesterase